MPNDLHVFSTEYREWTASFTVQDSMLIWEIWSRICQIFIQLLRNPFISVTALSFRFASTEINLTVMSLLMYYSPVTYLV